MTQIIGSQPLIIMNKACMWLLFKPIPKISEKVPHCQLGGLWTAR